MSARLTHRVASLAVVGALSAAALTGCGSSSSTTSGSGSPQGLSSEAVGAGFAESPALLEKMMTCLKAAGLLSSLPSGFPTEIPLKGPPSGYSSGGPIPKPSGTIDGGALLGNSEVRAALKACGITIPQPHGDPSGFSSPQ
jgi:hypothetical protein